VRKQNPEYNAVRDALARVTSPPVTNRTTIGWVIKQCRENNVNPLGLLDGVGYPIKEIYSWFGRRFSSIMYYREIAGPWHKFIESLAITPDPAVADKIAEIKRRAGINA